MKQQRTNGTYFEKPALRLKDKRGSIKTTGPGNSEQAEGKFKNVTSEREKTTTDRLEVKRAKLLRRCYKKLAFSRQGEQSPLSFTEFNEKPYRDFQGQEAQKETADLGVIHQKEPGEKEPEKAIGKSRQCKLQA